MNLRAGVVAFAALAATGLAQGNPRVPALLQRIAMRAPAYRGGLIDLAQAARDATTDQHIAVVASHPDDRYLMVAARQRSIGDRVTSILFTRGAGGQNNTGPEVGQQLGMLRTLETEAAAAILDFDTYYLDLEDDGYCRTGEEALDGWGRQNAVDRLAAAFRSVRPDVVVTTHHPDETHGHDLALLEVLPDSIALAADPGWRSPNDEPPHTVQRVFRGEESSERGPTLELDMTGVDQIRQRPFRDLAYDALTAAHRSQGPFRPKSDLFGEALRFVPLATRTGLTSPDGRGPAPLSLYEGITSLWTEVGPRETGDLQPRIEGNRDIEGLQDLVLKRSELLQSALGIRSRLIELGATRGRTQAARVAIARRVQALERLALHAAGVRVLIESPPGTSAIRGGEVEVLLTIQGGSTLRSGGATLWEPGTGATSLSLRDAAGRELGNSDAGPIRIPIQREELRLVATVRIADDTPGVLAASLFGNNPRYELPVGLVLTLSLPAEPHPLRFDLPLPIDVHTGIDLRVEPSSLLLPNGLRQVPFNVTATRLPGAPPPSGPLDIDARLGLDVEPDNVRPSLSRATRAWDSVFRLSVSDSLEFGVSRMSVRLGDERLRVRVSRIDCNVPGDLRVGLIKGVDDTSADVLRSLRGLVELVMLGPDELPTRDLSDLDSIIVDVRALAHRPDVGAAFERLCEFAETGGRLVVFYHKADEFNVEASGFRGYPRNSVLHIGKGRVTREDAPVRILDPEHAIFRIPNEIRPSDWDGWVQERGLYFADEWSADFKALVEMNDEGRPVEQGALLYARVGGGEYVYCALSLYRQLKTLNPGACRLFVNLITPLRRRGERR